MNEGERRSAYWKANIKLLSILLSIWFAVSYGFGILLKDTLDAVTFLGYPLGFWFAQQGSIFVFLVLIFIYAMRMNQLDKQFDFDEE